MAVKAKAEITISRITDIQSTTRYYLLQSSLSAAPSKPTANPPGGNWVTTEPAFQNGSTNTLYFVDQTIYTNSTVSYSAVSKSSSYEAAKEAYIKATEAAKTATNYVKTDTNGMVIGNVTNSTLGKNVLINTESLSIRDGSDILASYGEDITLYKDGVETFTIKESELIKNAITDGRFKEIETVSANSKGIWVKFESPPAVTPSGSILVYDPYTNIYLTKDLIYVIKFYVGSAAAYEPSIKYAIIKAPFTGRVAEFEWFYDSPSNIRLLEDTEEDVLYSICPCYYADYNAVTNLEINGGLWIKNNADNNGLVYGIPPLAIGDPNGARLELDNNEIMAKSDGETPTLLYLNMEGGDVIFNNNCDRSVMIRNGAIYMRNRGMDGAIGIPDEWYGVVDGVNDSGNTTFGYGGYSKNTGGTNIYGSDINLISNNYISISPDGTNANSPLYYGPGMTVNISIETAGFITDSGTSVRFAVPMARQLIGVKSVSASSLNGFYVRQNGKYLYGGSSSSYVKPSSYSVPSYNNHVFIRAKFSNNTNAVNNAPCGVYWNGKLTFN